MSSVYGAAAGGLQVLHAIATHDTPATAAELTHRLDAPQNQIQKTLTKLHRANYVVRRERPLTGLGANPYEYELAGGESDD
jgi:DNA-binding IclR family transcriptional regulator